MALMEWTLLRELAENAACEAGARLRTGAARLREVEFEDQRDVKLVADRESEELIRGMLAKESPYPVYGEEMGGDETLIERYEPYWVIDPLDGTYNYLRGSNVCAVSIGLMRGETPLLGVIYNFNTGTLYSGVVAERMTINGLEPATGWALDMEKAALVTGFPTGMVRSPERMQAFIERIEPYKKIRMIGSAALALAYVAGRIFDVYYEESIRLWDVAAGLALVQAAGGTVRMKRSSSGLPLAYDVWAGKDEFFG